MIALYITSDIRYNILSHPRLSDPSERSAQTLLACSCCEGACRSKARSSSQQTRSSASVARQPRAMCSGQAQLRPKSSLLSRQAAATRCEALWRIMRRSTSESSRMYLMSWASSSERMVKQAKAIGKRWKTMEGTRKNTGKTHGKNNGTARKGAGKQSGNACFGHARPPLTHGHTSAWRGFSHWFA